MKRFKFLTTLCIGAFLLSGCATALDTPQNLQTLSQPPAIEVQQPIVNTATAKATAPTPPVLQKYTPPVKNEVPKVPVATTPYAPNGTYQNVDGQTIPSPYTAPSIPAGASAQCRDGTYSFSQHRSGTCSHHGGVAMWY